MAFVRYRVSFETMFAGHARRLVTRARGMRDNPWWEAYWAWRPRSPTPITGYSTPRSRQLLWFEPQRRRELIRYAVRSSRCFALFHLAANYYARTFFPNTFYAKSADQPTSGRGLTTCSLPWWLGCVRRLCPLPALGHSSFVARSSTLCSHRPTIYVIYVTKWAGFHARAISSFRHSLGVLLTDAGYRFLLAKNHCAGRNRAICCLQVSSQCRSAS